MSDREELVEKVKPLVASSGLVPDDYRIKEIIDLIEQSRWISVDNHPEETCTVILHFKNGDMCFDRYDADRETFDFDEYKEHIENGGGFVTEATHWALSLPPTENR